MSVQRAMREHTSTDFVDWKVYLDEVLPNAFDPSFYYLAGIWAELAKANYPKLAKKITIESRLIKFKKVKNRGEKVVDEPESEEEILKRIDKSKKFFFAAVGLKSDGSLRKSKDRPNAPRPIGKPPRKYPIKGLRHAHPKT